MFELTINNAVYQFKFGMGFLKEINKVYQKPIDGVPNAKENVGLQMHVAGLHGGGCEYLVEVLDAANKGQNPRVTRALLEQYIDECEDIDQLFEDVLLGLKSSNATKTVACKMLEELVKAEANA